MEADCSLLGGLDGNVLPATHTATLATTDVELARSERFRFLRNVSCLVLRLVEIRTLTNVPSHTFRHDLEVFRRNFHLLQSQALQRGHVDPNTTMRIEHRIHRLSDCLVETFTRQGVVLQRLVCSCPRTIVIDGTISETHHIERNLIAHDFFFLLKRFGFALLCSAYQNRIRTGYRIPLHPNPENLGRNLPCSQTRRRLHSC